MITAATGWPPVRSTSVCPSGDAFATTSFASGLLANDVVAKASPDGHTLVLLTGGHPVAAVIMKERPYDPVRDFGMVSVVTGYPMVISVAAGSPTRTFADLIVRAKNERITFATSGPGSLHDLVGELVNLEVRVIVELPEVRRRLAELGGVPSPSTPEEMRERIEREIAKWKRVVELKKIERQ